MKKKYIFVTGGVVSSLGKGVASASIGAVLQSHGYSVKNRKFDPYLNIDPGHLSPLEHGEVYITHDGYMTDLDVGYYERFLNRKVNKTDSVSGGKIYWEVLNKEITGGYGSDTVQMVPHVSNAIKQHIINDKDDAEFNIYEIGGTVGDIEGLIFLEAIRQFAKEIGRENCMFVHLTLIPYLPSAKELKTKPTQNSVRDLLEKGIQADMLLCRSSLPLTENDKDKIALFCNLKNQNVITSLDLDNIYKIPLYYKEQEVDKRILEYFKMPTTPGNLSHFEEIKKYIDTCKNETTIAVVGNYFKTADAYKSLNESLFHAGLSNNVKVNCVRIDSEKVAAATSNQIKELLGDAKGILLPADLEDKGGFGNIINYAIKNNLPILGLGLVPMECFLKLQDMPFSKEKKDVKGAVEIEMQGKLKEIYGDKTSERFNTNFVISRIDSASIEVSTTSSFVAGVELKDKDFCIFVSYLPEYNSNPFNPNKLIKNFILHAIYSQIK